MIDALFADDIVTGPANKLAATAIKCLAVGGGFLFGYALGWLIASGLNRWVFASKAPEVVKRACCLLGGVALAIIVALIVFGSGGDGLFGGGGPGEAKGTATDDKGKTTPAPAPKEDPKVSPPKIESKPPEAKPTPGDVRIAILGGADVRDGKFYQIDADAIPRSLDELKKAIAERPKEPKAEVVLVFRFAKEPLSDSHPEMKKLSAWVKEAKLLSRFE